jgi:hypothetical protein
MVRLRLENGGIESTKTDITPLATLADHSPVSTLEEGSMISEPRYYGYADSYYGFDGLYYGYWQTVRVF